MATKTEKRADSADIDLVESTGAVKFDGEPVTATQPADAASTGAVPHEPPGTTEVPYYTEDVVVRAETPGPVTSTVSWLSSAQKKVVEAPAKAAPEAATAAKVKSKRK